MKKIIFTVAAIFAFGFANAQDKKAESAAGFSKGNIFLSGAISVSYESTGDANETSFGIEPKVGFFVSNNIAIGGKLGYMSNKGDNLVGVENLNNSTLSVGVFGRYYFTPANNFSVYANLGFDYNSTDVNAVAANPLSVDTKRDGFGIAISPGINYFLSNHWAIEASFGRLGYSTSKDDTLGAESTEEYGLNLDLRSITFGLLYRL